jgi:parvulin-like peptidyl-prolyl isomerase
MKQALFVLLAFLPVFLPSFLSAQSIPDDAIIARVGDERITVGEFRARFALGVFPYKDQERLLPVIRVQFLYSLIAERLLMAEAINRGFDAEDRFRRNRRLATEMFMRDRLFRDSVRGRVAVTEDEIRTSFLEEQQRIQYDFLFSKDEAELHNLQRLLKGGIDFDTLMAAQQRGQMGTDQGDAQGTAQGDARETAMDEDFRSRIDVLAPGAVSEPLRGEDGWYLVRKLDYGNPFRSEYELQKRWKRLESELRGRKEAEETITFVRHLWQGRSARFEEEPFRAIGQALLTDLRQQAAADTNEMLQPSSQTFDSVRNAWAQRLSEPFLRIGDTKMSGEEAKTSGEETSLSVGDALDRLEASDFRLAAEELSAFPELYRIRTRELADRFLVTTKAAGLGYEQHPDVRRDVGMWAANGLAEIMPELLWEQFIANDDSLWNYYITRPDLFGPPVEVKIIELLTDDETVLREAVADFQAGKSLQDLASVHSERPGAAERNGELGYFPVSEYGAIGRTAFGLRIADAAGPLETPDGYSFFQLVDKRYPGIPVHGWDALRDTVSAVARAGLTRAKTDQLLRNLASRSHISVNTDLLKDLPLKSMQMFSIRSLGFGGRIPAVPSVLPLYEAVMEGMEQRGDAAP